MAERVLEIKGFDELYDDLDDLQGGGGPISQAILDTMLASLSMLEQNIVAETPVGVGGAAGLRGSIYQEIEGTPVQLDGMVATGIFYGWYVEEGRGPGGPPPFDPIHLWVKRKGIRFMDKKGQPITTEATVNLIRWSIAKKGTKGAHMFQRGFDQSVPHIERMWDQLLEDIIEELAS